MKLFWNKIDSQSFKGMERDDMKCSHVQKMISRYVDQDLNQREKVSLELHTAECQSCKGALEQQIAIHRLLTSAENFQAPIGFATRVLAQIGEKKKRVPFWGFFKVQPVYLRAVEVAFALIVVLIGVMSGNLLVADRTPARQTSVGETFSLDLFQATPPDSIGGVYVKLMGASDER
jgi:predicted anti-sigma-YlaC factor YlaD